MDSIETDIYLMFELTAAVVVITIWILINWKPEE